MFKENLIDATRAYTIQLQKQYVSILKKVLKKKSKKQKQVYINIHNDLITAICNHQEGIEHIIINFNDEIIQSKLIDPTTRKKEFQITDEQDAVDYSKQKTTQGKLDVFTGAEGK